MDKKLYIRLSDTDISFAFYAQGDAESLTFVPYHAQPSTSLTVNLREAFRTEPSLQNVQTAEVLVTGPVTLVPLTEFQEEDCDAYYHLCFPQVHGKRVFYDSLSSGNGAVVLFALSEQACQTLEDTFSSVHYVSAQTPILRHLAQKPEVWNENKTMFINLCDDVADFYVFENGHVLLVNRYPVRSREDGAFYVLSVAKQLKMDVSTDKFFVYGNLIARPQLVEELQKFVANVHTLLPSEEFPGYPASKISDAPYDLLASLLK